MPTKTNNSPYTIAPAVLAPLIKAGIGGTANVISNYRQAKAAGEDYSFKEGAGDAITGMAGSFGMGGLFNSQSVANPNPQTNFTSDPTQTQPVVTSPEVMPQMTQLENIDPAQSQLSSLFGGQDPLNQTQSPNKMEKKSRTKMPAAYTMSYSPVNMSAYQAKEADKMMNISGALTLKHVDPTTSTPYGPNAGVRKISSTPSKIEPESNKPNVIKPGEHNLGVLDEAVKVFTGVRPSTVVKGVSKGVDYLKEKGQKAYDYYTNPNISTEEKVGKTVIELGKGAIGIPSGISSLPMNYQKAAPMMSGQSIYNMNHKK